MITKDPSKGSEMDNKALIKGSKSSTKIGSLLSVLTLVLSVLTFHYTLAVYILLGFFVRNSFKKEALKREKFLKSGAGRKWIYSKLVNQ